MDHDLGFMSKSKRLRLKDLRQIYALIGECCDLGRDAVAWRKHLADSLLKILGGRFAAVGEIPGYWTREPGLLPPIHTGWQDQLAHDTWMEHLRQGGPAVEPIFQAMVKLKETNSGRLLTRTREQLIPHQGWYNTSYFNDYRRLGDADDTIVSYVGFWPPEEKVQQREALANKQIVAQPEANLMTANVMSVIRQIGAPRYGARERRWLHWLHHELLPLIGNKLASLSQPSATDLTPRVRETLDCLLQGATEKEIAKSLGISPTTVHEYVMQIYRHFGVRSRPALMALWIPRQKTYNNGTEA